MSKIKRRTSGNAKPELRTKGTPTSSALLPLVHVTAVGAAREIIDARQLETRPCKIFGKNLLYFFALRPAYRSRDSDTKSDQINRFPFVFIVKPDHLGTPHHVYPFDTGAASSGRFGAAPPDPYVFLEDYELEPSLSSINGQIGWAFGTSSDYYRGDLKIDLATTIKNWESVCASFLKIAGLASSLHNNPDKRASSIEVAYARHVPLKGHAILAILPKQLLESGTASNDELIKKLNTEQISWEMYDWQPNSAPADHYEKITNIARTYFESKGTL